MTAREKYEQVRQRVKEGSTIADACRELNWNAGSYSYQDSKNNPEKEATSRKRKYAPRRIEIPVTTVVPVAGGKLFAFVGSPNDVLEAIRGLQ